MPWEGEEKEGKKKEEIKREISFYNFDRVTFKGIKGKDGKGGEGPKMVFSSHFLGDPGAASIAREKGREGEGRGNGLFPHATKALG